MLRFLFPFLLGALVGAGGYYVWLDYGTALTGDDVAITNGPSVLEILPYGMQVEKTNFAKRPVFCIEQPERKTEVEQVCKVSPGFYATFVNDLLHSVEWNVAEGARFQNEWRKAGLSTNQSGSEFMNIARTLGATKIRFEDRTDKRIVLTFDVGDMSYRLWLSAAGPAPKATTQATDPEAADDDAPPDLGIGTHFVVTRLATILSFE